jgi:NaMN:DMB phosphoribosyltransferase
MARSPESPLAFRAAKQAVPALAIENVSTIQASNTCGNLFASQLGVQPWVMTAQPQGKPST